VSIIVCNIRILPGFDEVSYTAEVGSIVTAPPDILAEMSSS